MQGSRQHLTRFFMKLRNSVNHIEAVARVYHSWITGLVLSIVSRKGSSEARDFVFTLFRNQHEEKFLIGLKKLEIDNEPDAVACAKYHYFSNQLGGVSVEFLEESPEKAWIRYPPPRWIWSGTAICAIPSEVNRAMLYGWHAQNGVTLKNAKLGFVCTGTTVDGFPGLEGFYREFEQPLEKDQRLQFRFDLTCPQIDPKYLPALDSATWPDQRKAKAYRNYSMEFVRNALPVLVDQFGPEEAQALGTLNAKQIGMQHYHDLSNNMEITGRSPEDFIKLLNLFFKSSGDFVVGSERRYIERTNRKLFPGLPHKVVSECETSLLEGFLSSHNRFLRLKADTNGDNDRFTVVNTT